MKKKLLPLLLLTLLLPSNSFAYEGYKIEKHSCVKPYKCSYDVRIKYKISEEQIKIIANRIKKETPKVKKYLLITIYPAWL